MSATATVTSGRLHALLDESASRDPERLAYVDARVRVSYGALARSAAGMAAGLAHLGVRKGGRVALVLDGCVEYLAAYHGTLAAGGVVVPTSPDTRPRVLAHALGHSRAEVAVIAAVDAKHLVAVVSELPSLRAIVVVGKAIADVPGVEVVAWDNLVSAGTATFDGGASGADLASINYTSGTTGRPKGVMLSHDNLVANVRSIVSYLELGAADTVAMVLPFHYVYGISVLHTHIAAGGTIANVGSMAFPAKVLEAVAVHGCTGLSGVPSTFARLLQMSDLSRYDLSSLRYVTQAGAAMAPALIARVRAAIPRARIFVMYGQTEASARLSYVPPERLDEKLGSAGIAIPGVELAIVDPAGRALAPGEVGEIAARGANVMQGYLDDPEATARALRHGWLHTGDLGHMDDDGFVFIAGRQSDMIKSGGHRMGPHEIEEVIAEIPGVLECAVVGVDDPLLGQAVAAFVVPAPGVELDERSIKKACFVELPRYKQPSHVRIVDSLPKSDRGKVLRTELRERFARERDEPAGDGS